MIRPAEFDIAEKLRTLIRGEVVEDENVLLQCSRDQSIYEIKPLAVVLPQDNDDIRKVVAVARDQGITVTARGGGSGTAGSALGNGIVVLLPKKEPWTRISGFSSDADSARVTVGAGVYHNDLQKFLRERGFFLPADVTSAAISRIGGNIATRASGPHALKYGSIDRFLESLQFITAEDEIVDTADETTIPQRFKTGLQDLEQRIKADDKARGILEARKRFKTASGYNLFALIADESMGWRIAQLLCGSVGTLGFITRATLRAEIYERERAAVLLYFNDLAEIAPAISALRQMNVAAIELISRETLGIIRERSDFPLGTAGKFFPDAHVLLVDVTGSQRLDRVEKITVLVQKERLSMSAAPVLVVNESEIESLWNLRKQILWLIEHPKPGFRALAVVNDVGVPPERLSGFITDVLKVFNAHRVTSAIYGHAGNGNLHLRPLFDTALPDIGKRMRLLANDVYGAVLRYGGTISAEHGMGRLRAPYLKQEWGEALYGYMREVKNIFDPADMFNPNVMFSEAPITNHMRSDLLEP